ncbi:hypothetical protein C8Q80DRAFT_1216361 [Daedaleopsis nitida]|nr:hypothetical protein C8Q80DRAFT_1216361 [Daedaleopsis nitida]
MVARTGGRKVDETRAISIVYERLDRVDGSARFGFGETKALASISGPIEVRPAQENPSQATLDVLIRPLAALPGTDAKALASTLKSIFAPSLFLSHLPRTLIQIVGQALCGSESGSGTGSVGRGRYASLTAGLVNATAAALVNAGSVPMRGVVCAVAVGRLRTEAGAELQLVLDPEESELPKLAGSGCFAFLFSSLLSHSPSSNTGTPACSLLWTNYTTGAPFDVSELAKARELAEQGARQVWAAMKRSIGSVEDVNVEVKTDVLSQQPPYAMHVDDDKVEI